MAAHVVHGANVRDAKGPRVCKTDDVGKITEEKPNIHRYSSTRLENNDNKVCKIQLR